MESKICSRCKESKPKTAEFFYSDSRYRDGYLSYCKPCQIEAAGIRAKQPKYKAKRKEWAKANPDKVRLSNLAWRNRNLDKCRERDLRNAKRQNKELRHDAIMAYGGYECVCHHNGKQCGVSKPEFLSIDHISGGGYQHKKQIGGPGNFYRWLRKNNYPSGFRILCHNCNQAKGAYGYCPLAEPSKGVIKNVALYTQQTLPPISGGAQELYEVT